MIAAAITGGDVLIDKVITDHLEPISAKLMEAGVEVIKYDDSIRVKASNRVKAVDFKTLPFQVSHRHAATDDGYDDCG